MYSYYVYEICQTKCGLSIIEPSHMRPNIKLDRADKQSDGAHTQLHKLILSPMQSLIEPITRWLESIHGHIKPIYLAI